MASTPEGKIQLKIMQYLKKQGHLFWRNTPNTYDPKLGIYKSNPYVMKGLPDIMVVGERGRLIGLEVKAPKGRPSPDQLLAQRNFELAGAGYNFVKSVEDVVALGL